MTERSGFFAVVDSFPTRAAFVDTRGDRATYGDLAARMNECARGLATLGLVPGDTVAVVMSNRRELLETYGAAVQTGLTFVAVNWHLGETEIAYILEDAAAKAVIADGQFAEAARAAADSVSLPDRSRFSLDAGGGFRPCADCAPGRAATSSAIGAPDIFYVGHNRTAQRRAQAVAETSADDIELRTGIGMRADAAGDRRTWPATPSP
jgi:long-chain acyl-CoA synthetase